MKKYLLLFSSLLFSSLSLASQQLIVPRQSSVVAVQTAPRSIASFVEDHVSSSKAGRIAAGTAALLGVVKGIFPNAFNPEMLSGLTATAAGLGCFLGYFVVPAALIGGYIAYEMSRKTAKELANQLPENGFELVKKIVSGGIQVSWLVALSYGCQIVYNAVLKRFGGPNGSPEAHDIAILSCMLFVVVTLYVVKKLTTRYTSATNDDDYLFSYEPYQFVADHVHYFVYGYATLSGIFNLYEYSIRKYV